MDDTKAIIEASRAWEEQDLTSCYEFITEGLKANYRNYELYLMLGQYYSLYNPNQAYLCYENALFFCKEADDRKIIEEFIEALDKQNKIRVNKIAIILLSYNNAQMTIDCIESIRKNNDENTYELIVVDNASTDGIRGWLKGQKKIHLILNETNRGFPAGCNQGIIEASQNTDILLLNNDTIIPPCAIFWLRMGLYEEENIGAVGSVSNNAVNYQQVGKDYKTLEEWIEYGTQNNIPNKNPYESKGWLMGFAMLIRRKALDKIGYLDERFTPGNYEDNDYSIRLLLEGYRLLLCKNSFIFHYGSQSFESKSEQYWSLLKRNERKLEEKWEINFIPYNKVDSDIIEQIMPDKEEFSLLEIGCKLGCTLARIKSRYPCAYVIGTEHREKLYMLAKGVSNVVPVNIENTKISDGIGFDYIILDKSLTVFKNPGIVLEKAKKLLNSQGKILLSINNRDFIRGKSSESIDREGLSLNDIVSMLNEVKLRITDIAYVKGKIELNEEQNLVKGQDAIVKTAKSFLLILEDGEDI